MRITLRGLIIHYLAGRALIERYYFANGICCWYSFGTDLR